MDKADFDKAVLDPIADKPQLHGLAVAYLAELHAACDGLMGLGHRVALGFASAPAPQEWPKMLYTGAGVGPGETMMVSTTEEQAKALAEGWRTTPRPEAPPIPVRALNEPAPAKKDPA